MQLAFTLLSLVLILCCLFLGLLILVQLPKKEAGLGQAFGGATTEALFGAGSGNTLTKLTKYCAGGFIILCVLLAWMSAHTARTRDEGIRKELGSLPNAAAAAAPALGRIGSNAAPVAGLITNPAATVLTNAPAPATAPGAPK